MSIDETFFPFHKTDVEKKIQDIADIVSTYRNNGKQTVCAHAFSNGGAMLLMYVSLSSSRRVERIHHTPP